MPVKLPDNFSVSPSVPGSPLRPTDAEARFEQLMSLSGWSNPGKALIHQLQPLYGPERIVRNFYDERQRSWDVPRYLQDWGLEDLDWLRRFLAPGDTFATGDVGELWLDKLFLRDDPVWLTQLLRRDQANVARVFALSGNIADYAFDPCRGYRPALDLLSDTLQRTKDCVISISLSQGVTVSAIYKPEKAKEVREKVDSLLPGGIFNPQQPLTPQICRLFSQLRHWLEDSALSAGANTRLDNGLAIIFPNAHLLIPQAGGYTEHNFLIDSLLSWSLSSKLFQTKHCIILVSEFLEDISQELVARGGKIDKVFVPRPATPEARLKFLLALLQREPKMSATRYHQQYSSTHIALLPDEHYVDGLKRLANETAGLNFLGIEDVIQEANLEGVKLSSRRLMQAKGERLKQESEGLLEIIPADGDLSRLAGYKEIKSRLKEIIQAFRHLHRDPLVRDTFPMGILFLGPPGTGKTVAAKAIAGESGVNMVKLGDFRGQYVGQSERNLSQLLRLLESLYPVIVFIDEIDQQEGQRGDSGDSGVSRRIFGKLLEFMSDTTHRGQILWIAASNQPKLIDPAMKRPGRFDLILPFLLPDRESRKQILRYVLESRLKSSQHITHELADGDWEDIANATEGFSGAEIEGLVNELLRQEINEFLKPHTRGPDFSEANLINRQVITKAAFDKVRASYQPPAIHHEYHKMEDLALGEVRFEDLVPEEYRSRWKELQKEKHGLHS